MSNTISWILQMSVRDGQRSNALELMREMVAATKEETGTQAYHWYLSQDGMACHIYERYDDSDAVMAHLGNFGAFAERFMACFEPTSFFVYGDPSAEAREALAGFGAVYLDPIGGFHR